jgi:hypothetical protein
VPRRRHSREVIVTVRSGRGYTDGVTTVPMPRRPVGTRAIVLVLAGAATPTLLLERGWISRHSPAAGGNAARGGQLFAGLVCPPGHDVDHPWPGGEVPNLGNIATEAARIVGQAVAARSHPFHRRARGIRRGPVVAYDPPWTTC